MTQPPPPPAVPPGDGRPPQRGTQASGRFVHPVAPPAAAPASGRFPPSAPPGSGRFPPSATPGSGQFVPGGPPPSGQLPAVQGAPTASGRFPGAGPTMIGPYAVQSELGRGGMGVVYAGWDAGLGRSVAIKVVTKTSPRALTRFEREARVLGRLSHPNVVPVHSTGVHNGHPYVAMELVQGESLEARIDRDKQLPEVEVLRLGLGLARALAHAHGLGVVHRDVKPANVLIGGDGVPRLTDFGLALDLEEEGRLSQSGVALGSPGWWAPEQAAGERHRVSPATDVYGLGATLYNALAGRPPHLGDSVTELISATLAGAPPLAQQRPGVRADVAAIVHRCLAKAPEDRYPSMEALAAALDAAISGRPAARAGVPPWLVALVAVTAVGAAFVLGRTTTSPGPAPTPAPSPTPTPTPVAPPSPVAPPPVAVAPPPTPATPATPATTTTPTPTTPPTTPAPGGEVATLVDRATALARARRPAEALPLAQRAYELGPDDRAAISLLGLVLMDLERDQEALPLLRRAIELGAGPRVRARLGSALINAGQYEEAEAALVRAIADDPSSAQAWADRGIARLNLGRSAEAVDDARRAIELDPTFPRARFTLGTALMRLGRSTEALEAFDRAIELEGGSYPAARRVRGATLAHVGKWADAVHDFTVALDSSTFGPDVQAELHENRGFARAMLNDRAGARADYDAAFAIRPRAAGLLRKRATLALVEGRTADALVDLEVALQLEPQDATALGLRGAARMNGGQWREALEDLDRAIAIDGPTATDSSAQQNRLNHAAACLERGRIAEAEADATWLLERDPRSNKASIIRARARVALGRPEEALVDASRAIDGGAQGGNAHLARGEALLALGRKDDARRDLGEAVRRLPADTPNAARARDLLARCDRP